jgi:hypothetical protein
MSNAFEDFRMALAEPRESFRSIGTDPAGRELVSVGDQTCALRRDQVCSARWWKVAIQIEDQARDQGMAKFILGKGVTRLTGDISCINRLYRAQSSGRLRQAEQIRWATGLRGLLFERLMAGILNEDEYRARRASLFEDLFEWTDLRVKYPDLDRKRGARVQVKLIADEHLEEEQTAARRHSESYVILSPVRLARYVEVCCDNGITHLVGPDFWHCLGTEPADTAELAAALTRIFESALGNGSRHPLGPMVHVPPSVRGLVRSYVKTEAFNANERMLESRAGSEGLRPGWTSRL